MKSSSPFWIHRTGCCFFWGINSVNVSRGKLLTFVYLFVLCCLLASLASGEPLPRRLFFSAFRWFSWNFSTNSCVSIPVCLLKGCEHSLVRTAVTMSISNVFDALIQSPLSMSWEWTEVIRLMLTFNLYSKALVLPCGWFLRPEVISRGVTSHYHY